MTADDYDGRHQYVHPPAVPRPPKEIEDELARIGAEVGAGFESDPRYLLTRAKYRAWLADQGIEGHPDPLHGHAPTEVTDDEGEDTF